MRIRLPLALLAALTALAAIAAVPASASYPDPVQGHYRGTLPRWPHGPGHLVFILDHRHIRHVSTPHGTVAYDVHVHQRDSGQWYFTGESHGWSVEGSWTDATHVHGWVEAPPSVGGGGQRYRWSAEPGI
jgi:hypothetical protein